MDEPRGYQVGDVANGYRWNGTSWEPVPPPSPTSAGAPPLLPPPVMGVPTPVPTTTPAQAASGLFWAGVAVALAVSAITYFALHSDSGGIFWFGGYFLTVGLWRRAYARAKAAESRSGTRLSQPARAIAGVVGGAVVVLAIGISLAWIGSYNQPHGLTDKVGSCWTDNGTTVSLVDCADPNADYVAVSIVSTGSERTTCPSEAIGSVTVSGHPDSSLCLDRRGAAGAGTP
ncbi:MAG: hypothetical protein GC157_04585 [Frankiales bacterium]|nr:hypothetical protein [Frankiales bacterium]